MAQVRVKSTCKIFGGPVQLKKSLLPTYENVIKHYFWVRNEFKSKSKKKDPGIAKIANTVAKDIEEIWETASILTVSHRRVVDLIKKYYERYKHLYRAYESKNKVILVKKFVQDAKKKLFDIASCKCSDYSKCKCKFKIPINERNFLVDQRSERKMMIGSTDFKTSKKLKAREARKEKASSRENLFYNSGSSSEPKKRKRSVSLRTPEVNQNRLKLPNLSAVCDRTGASDRTAALIASAVLQDLGIVSKNNTEKVIDRSKIRRERKKVRHELQSVQAAESPSGIFFDGKKDKTLILEKKGKSQYRKTVTEEHIVLLAEPDSIYLGHVTPSGGSAEKIKKSFVEFFTENNVDTSQIKAIGSDSTAVNTGSKNGIIARLERFLGRPVHWLICLLHINELPLRHLFQELDGSTTGPNSFSGMIGKELPTCENLKVVRFIKIPTIIPEIDFNDLSSDQKYLYEICKAISSGEMSSNLENRNPGKMSHARWLTTASRIVRLYASKKKPSKNLKILVQFVLKVYAPSWFEIKCKPLAKHGPTHLLSMIQKSEYLPNNLKRIVHETIQRSGYFCHSENILFSMLQDDSKDIQDLALNRIIEIRKKCNPLIRTFQVPTINFSASKYFDLIDWNNFYEPPLTKSLTEDGIKFLIRANDFPKFPCHSQAVERHVRLVSEASALVCGAKERDGLIRSRIKSRKEIPKFETKKQFFCKNKKKIYKKNV